MKKYTLEEYMADVEYAKSVYHSSPVSLAQLARSLKTSPNVAHSMLSEDKSHEKRMKRFKARDRKAAIERLTAKNEEEFWATVHFTCDSCGFTPCDLTIKVVWSNLADYEAPTLCPYISNQKPKWERKNK